MAIAVSALGMKIASGEFPASAPLPVEAELATQLNVGRSVVREAVKVLASKGVLTAKPRIGTYISPRERWHLFDEDVLSWLLEQEELDLGLVRDILTARKIIEPEAAYLAATNAGCVEKRALMEAYQLMAASTADQRAAVASDIRFHTQILSASGNAVLVAFSPIIEAVLTALFRISIQNPGIFTENLEAHREVAKRIEENSAEAARHAMRNLLSVTEDDLQRRMAL